MTDRKASRSLLKHGENGNNLLIYHMHASNKITGRLLGDEVSLYVSGRQEHFSFFSRTTSIRL